MLEKIENLGKKRLAAIVVVLIVVMAIPFTILQVRQNQENRSRASEVTATVINSIEFDADSSGFATNAASLSWQHTIGQSSNRVLIVGIEIRDDEPANNVTSIAYHDVFLQHLGDKVSENGEHRTELWWLANPATGSATITVVLDGSAAAAAVGVATSWSGVDQTLPTSSAYFSEQGTALTTSLLVPSVEGDIIVDVLGKAEGGLGSQTPGSNQTIRARRVSTPPSDTVAVMSSMPGSPSAALRWTFDQPDFYSLSAVILKPAISANPSTTPIASSTPILSTAPTTVPPTPTTIPDSIRIFDFNDDGRINELDLNTLYRGFSRHQGD